MENNNQAGKKYFESGEDNSEALHYVRVFTDTAREPFLILNFDLRVITANASFYKTFQVTKEETEGKLVYELGNGQWDIPELRKLLEDILPKSTVFNEYEVSHEFPSIGKKTMLLNARKFNACQQILLAIEDITIKREAEVRLSHYVKDLEEATAKGIALTKSLEEKIEELTKLTKAMVGREARIVALKEEVIELKKKLEKK